MNKTSTLCFAERHGGLGFSEANEDKVFHALMYLKGHKKEIWIDTMNYACNGIIFCASGNTPVRFHFPLQLEYRICVWAAD